MFAFNAYSYCSVCHFTPGFVCTFSLSRLGVWCLLRQYYNNPFWPVTAFYLTWPCVNSLVICSCMDVHCLPSAVYVCLVHILSIMKVFVVWHWEVEVREISTVTRHLLGCRLAWIPPLGKCFELNASLLYSSWSFGLGMTLCDCALWAMKLSAHWSVWMSLVKIYESDC